jgi:hypothetical protein
LEVNDIETFLRTPDAIKKKRNADGTREKRNIVIDRSHKIPIDVFGLMLKKFTGSKFFLFGDSMDYGVHSTRGYDNVFRSLVLSFACVDRCNKWDKWNPRDPMYSKYHSALSASFQPFLPKNIEKWTNFIDDLKVYDKATSDTSSKLLTPYYA